MDATSTCPFLSFFGMSLSVSLAHMPGNVWQQYYYQQFCFVFICCGRTDFTEWVKRPFGVGKLTCGQNDRIPVGWCCWCCLHISSSGVILSSSQSLVTNTSGNALKCFLPIITIYTFYSSIYIYITLFISFPPLIFCLSVCLSVFSFVYYFFIIIFFPYRS